MLYLKGQVFDLKQFLLRVNKEDNLNKSLCSKVRLNLIEGMSKLLNRSSNLKINNH